MFKCVGAAIIPMIRNVINETEACTFLKEIVEYDTRSIPIHIQIVSQGKVNKQWVSHVQTWTNEVIRKGPLSNPPPNLLITIWKTTAELQAFYHREREELGVVTGEETEFLATHEAWRGHPRIHICEERLKGVPEAVIQGTLHHEISHALHHGSPEFYTFRFSNRLQEIGRSCGLDLQSLKYCVYLLSVAIKDQEAIRWLAEIGLGFSQRALLEYLVSDTQEERKVWEVARGSPGLRKLAIAALLKIPLSIEAMISSEAQALKDKWNKAYEWLSDSKRMELLQFAKSTLQDKGKSFQERLEQATIRFLTDPSL